MHGKALAVRIGQYALLVGLAGVVLFPVYITVVNSVLLQPLHLHKPEQLLRVR